MTSNPKDRIGKMNEYNALLNSFKNLSLEDLKSVQLLNRHDTKFVFNKKFLPEILSLLSSSYKILKINGCNRFTYNNVYFDTNNLLFYNQHHNEKRNRYKVRFRNYSATDDCFFEIKTKNNKNRTIKNRIKVDQSRNHLNDNEKQMLTELTTVSADSLEPKLNVDFSRITLSDNELTERLTIDTNLSVKNGIAYQLFDQLVIAEIKQNMYNPKSRFIQIIRKLKISEMRFSKYCMGILHVNKDIKYNRFKPKLMQIGKILNSSN